MTRPLVKLDRVDVALDGQHVLHHVNWSLFPRQHWAIFGPNGSGKSTLLRLIRGELWPAPGSSGERTYAFDGDEQTSAVGIREIIALVSPELQNRYLQQEWTLTGAQVVESGVGGGDYLYQRLTPTQQRHVQAVSRLLGVQPLFSRDVQTLSTGELRKVLIARALAGSPRVLICDEIRDGLDATSRRGLLALLKRVSLSGTQLLYSTHREEETVSFLTHRLRLDRGRVVEKRKIKARPVPETWAAGDALLPENPIAGARPAPSGRQPPRNNRTPPGRPLILIREANVFVGPKQALYSVDLEVRSGQHWGIVGPNGAGKSTLLKLILGDLHPAWGSKVRRFAFTARHPLWEVKRNIGYISPELQSTYHESITGADVVASGFFSSIGLNTGVSRRQKETVTLQLRRQGLQALAHKSILQMSYGEFRKILLARALVHRPELLLCDEPFDGLDPAAREAMAHTLETLALAGTSLILVTHHPDDLPACLTHMLQLRDGRVTFQGPI